MAEPPPTHTTTTPPQLPKQWHATVRGTTVDVTGYVEKSVTEIWYDAVSEQQARRFYAPGAYSGDQEFTFYKESPPSTYIMFTPVTCQWSEVGPWTRPKFAWVQNATYGGLATLNGVKVELWSAVEYIEGGHPMRNALKLYVTVAEPRMQMRLVVNSSMQTGATTFYNSSEMMDYVNVSAGTAAVPKSAFVLPKACQGAKQGMKAPRP